MDVIEAVMGRRSIRKYTNKEVPDETVKQLLRAAMSAPSAGNEQPWQFIVIRQRAILDAIPSIHPHSHMLKEAALAIAICGDLNFEVFKDFWVQDCSAATQNMLIAAHGLGIGAVWLGFFPLPDRVTGLKRLLSLPEHVIPLSMVSMGWPAEEKAPTMRYLEDRVHYDKW